MTQARFGYSWQAGEEVEDAYEQALIDLIFDLREDQGLTFQAIADYLEQAGYVNKSGNCRWVKSQVWRIYRDYREE